MKNRAEFGDMKGARMDTSLFTTPLGWIVLGYAIGTTFALLLRSGRREGPPPVQPVVYQRDTIPDDGLGCTTLAAIGLLALAFIAYLVLTYG
jgi:hypothetical protein